jgi:hypothetical protein
VHDQQNHIQNPHPPERKSSRTTEIFDHVERGISLIYKIRLRTLSLGQGRGQGEGSKNEPRKIIIRCKIRKWHSVLNDNPNFYYDLDFFLVLIFFD